MPGPSAVCSGPQEAQAHGLTSSALCIMYTSQGSGLFSRCSCGGPHLHLIASAGSRKWRHQGRVARHRGRNCGARRCHLQERVDRPRNRERRTGAHIAHHATGLRFLHPSPRRSSKGRLDTSLRRVGLVRLRTRLFFPPRKDRLRALPSRRADQVSSVMVRNFGSTSAP